MTTRQPGIFIDHRRQPFRRLGIGALPQRAKRAAGRHDRQIADIIGGCDFGQLVGHARAAGHARDHPLGLFQHAMQDALRPAHFPQHVDVDRAPAIGNLIGALDLLDRAVDRIGDQFLMAVAAGAAVIDLGDDIAETVIAVGIDGGHRADAASRRPGTGTRMVGHRNALAAFDQRPDFAATIDDRLQPLEHQNLLRQKGPAGRPGICDPNTALTAPDE